jgi:lysozyme
MGFLTSKNQNPQGETMSTIDFSEAELRRISDDGVKFIQSFESYKEKLPDGRCKAYQCIVGRDKKGRPIYDGKWTIGWGCTEGVTEGMIWTREQADRAFHKELSVFQAAVNRLVKVPLSQNAFDALVSFAYNCGEGALSKSSLLKKLNKGDYEGAAQQFGYWVNSNGVKNVPGLVRRRRDEAAVFLRPDKPATATQPETVPDMPQTVEAPTPVAKTVKGSRTISGALVTLAGTIGAFFKDAIGIVMEAASQIEIMAPAATVLSGLGFTTERVLFAMAIAGIAWVLFARIDDAKKGANTR